MKALPPVPGPEPAPEPPDHSPGGDAGALQARYVHELDAWLERWKQQVAAQAADSALAAAREDADRADEAALLKAMQDAYVAVTSSSLDRALTRLNVVTASIGAVTTIYTGLLALTYAAKSPKGTPLKPLTPAAMTPAVFLGIALFLVTIYAAVFRGKVNVGPLLPTGIGGQLTEMRLITFMKWCFAGVLARSWALHAGIVSMGIGVATLPVPFVNMTAAQHTVIFWAGLGLVVVSGVASWWWNRRESSPA